MLLVTMLKTFFRGDIKLWKMFWLVCLPLHVANGIFVYVVAPNTISLFGLSVQSRIIVWLIGIVHFLACVFLWQSAKKYRGNKVFKFAAKSYSAIIIFTSLSSMIVTVLLEIYYWV